MPAVKKRIARGSGTSVEEINMLVKDFRQSHRMLKKMGLLGKTKRGMAGKQLLSNIEGFGHLI